DVEAAVERTAVDEQRRERRAVAGVDGVVVVGDQLLDGEDVLGRETHAALLSSDEHSVTDPGTLPHGPERPGAKCREWERKHGCGHRRPLGRAGDPGVAREDLRPPRRPGSSL